MVPSGSDDPEPLKSTGAPTAPVYGPPGTAMGNWLPPPPPPPVIVAVVVAVPVPPWLSVTVSDTVNGLPAADV